MKLRVSFTIFRSDRVWGAASREVDVDAGPVVGEPFSIGLSEGLPASSDLPFRSPVEAVSVLGSGDAAILAAELEPVMLRDAEQTAAFVRALEQTGYFCEAYDLDTPVRRA